MGIGLREVPPHPHIRSLVVLRKQTKRRDRSMDTVHDFPGLVGSARVSKRLHQPEGADDESYLWRSEAVIQSVPKQPAIIRQLMANGIYRSGHPGVLEGQKSQVSHLQQ